MAAWVMEVPVPQQNYGGVGNGDIPVEIFFFGFGQVQHPPVFLHDPTLFQVIDVGAFGMQYGFQVGELFHYWALQLGVKNISPEITQRVEI